MMLEELYGGDRNAAGGDIRLAGQTGQRRKQKAFTRILDRLC